MSRFDGGSFLNRIDKAPRTIVFGAYLLPLDFYLGLSLELWKVISNSEK